MTTRKKPDKRVQKVFTWFKWLPCHKCKREFRRETGYQSIIIPPQNHQVIDKYLCSTCGFDMETASIRFEDVRKEFRNYIPKLPTNPPKRK